MNGDPVSIDVVQSMLCIDWYQSIGCCIERRCINRYGINIAASIDTALINTAWSMDRSMLYQCCGIDTISINTANPSMDTASIDAVSMLYLTMWHRSMLYWTMQYRSIQNRSMGYWYRSSKCRAGITHSCKKQIKIVIVVLIWDYNIISLWKESVASRLYCGNAAKHHRQVWCWVPGSDRQWLSVKSTQPDLGVHLEWYDNIKTIPYYLWSWYGIFINKVLLPSDEIF